MTTTVRFGADGKVAEIKHANLLRVGTAIVSAPAGGGAEVATTAQGMSPDLAGVLTAGIDAAPGGALPTP